MDLEILLDLFGVHDAELRAALVTLSRESRKRGWWYDHKDAIDRAFFDFIAMEAEASHLRSYQNHVVPGLFQTEEYARAVYVGTGLHDDIAADNLVELRMERQKILLQDDAPRVTAVVHEAALRVLVGGPQTMKEQLLRLAEINDPQRTSIQVLPNAHGAHPSVEGSFLIMSYPGPANWDVVFVDHMMGGRYVEETEHVEQFCRSFDHLRSIALSLPQSNDLIRRLARELD